MQTLSEFYENWSPGIIQQAKEIGAKAEAGRNMSLYLALEPKLRPQVDAACLSYVKSLSGESYTPSNPEVGYLFSLRLLAGVEFAQFLEHSGLGMSEMDAEDWVSFFLIDAWHRYLVYEWRSAFSQLYGTSTQ